MEQPPKEFKNKIPKKIKLFGTTYNIIWDNKRLNDKEVYGLCDKSKNQIILSTTFGLDKLAEDRIIETYYHELVHAILEAMFERELSSNEQFVDIFSKLIRQAIESAEF